LNIRKYLRRTGCTVLLVLWFLFLLTPCLMITLAVQHEIVLTHSDIPGDEFRIWLIQDVQNRGLGLSNTIRKQATSGETCTIADGRFFLWQGKANPYRYCSCYTKQANLWSSVAEGDDACKLIGE
jgi:hypothetical protein